MNILREVRRVRNKSMPVRIMLLLAFCVIFVVTTYAWFSTQRDVDITGMKLNVEVAESLQISLDGEILLNKDGYFKELYKSTKS